jgi:hypothetical protein
MRQHHSLRSLWALCFDALGGVIWPDSLYSNRSNFFIALFFQYRDHVSLPRDVGLLEQHDLSSMGEQGIQSHSIN